jgi:D-tyrosyl-tRNA(Tyr) deacylase
MRVVIQRVNHASVSISGNVHSSIGKGLLVLVGIEDADDDTDVNWITGKIIQLRIFNDSEGVMNLSLKEINGDLLLVSQFTLHASTRKGNRPSYIRASKPDKAVPLYEQLIGKLREELGRPVHTGVFGADMQVALENDGPVTIIIDSKNKE